MKDNNYNILDIHVEIVVMARGGTLQGPEGNYFQAPPLFFFILEFLTTPILGVFCQFWIENKITFLKVVIFLICDYLLVVYFLTRQPPILIIIGLLNPQLYIPTLDTWFFAIILIFKCDFKGEFKPPILIIIGLLNPQLYIPTLDTWFFAIILIFKCNFKGELKIDICV